MTIMPGRFAAAAPEPRRRKLAEGVAAAIARDIMAMGWPVGRSVGSMQGLLARYGVSHAVLREAVRQIEQNGLAVMRRGAGGGLVISQRPEDVAAQTLATYLQLTDVDISELTAANNLAEDAILTAAQATHLRVLAAQLEGGRISEVELVVRYNRFIAALSDAACNPLLSVMSKAALRSTLPALALGDQAKHGMNEHAVAFARRWVATTEAVIAGDAAAAIEIQRAERPRTEARNAERAAERRRQAQAGAATLIATEILEAVDEGRGRKHGQLVALSIARDIAAKGWPQGHHLGLEPALLAEYQVSRNIFREAARILEVHGVCSAKRGQRGGFIVGRPRPDYAVETAVTSLGYMGVQPGQVAEMRLALQPHMAGMAASTNNPQSAAALVEAVAVGDEGAAGRFLHALGPAAGNRALALMNEVVLGVEYDLQSKPASEIETRLAMARDGAKAVQAHDEPLARRALVDLCRLDYAIGAPTRAGNL
jgi:DNA-binding FadR family transcriptional regulator